MNSDARQTDEKFFANWQCPFRMLADVGKGAYKLEYIFGEPGPRTWNVTHLKFYYS